MACLDMYNNTSSSSSSSTTTNTNSTTTQPPQAPPPPLPPPAFISPRISFSNDFVVDSHQHSLVNPTTTSSSSSSSSTNVSRQVPSSDFEFSVSDLNMMSAADELFCKGKILPFRGSANRNGNPRTLRDELLDNDDDDNNNNNNNFFLKPPKASSSSSSSSSQRWKNFLGLRKSHIGSKKPDFTSQTVKSSQDAGSNEDTSSSEMELGV